MNYFLDETGSTKEIFLGIVLQLPGRCSRYQEESQLERKSTAEASKQGHKNFV
jgi:hypothetical protein